MTMELGHILDVCIDEIEDKESDSECSNTALEDESKEVTLFQLNSLPEKSRIKYERQYELFVGWCRARSIMPIKISEKVLISYFSEKSSVNKSSTLWSIYSMLKSTVQVKHDIDISNFRKLIAFLKQQAKGYKSKKSKTFTKYEVRTFLLEAPDDKYLMEKVVLIFGIAGACGRDELVKMAIDDVEDQDSILIVTIPPSSSNKSRVYTVSNDNSDGVDYLLIYRKYVSLRPAIAITPRLFLRCNEGVCTNQVVGMNTIGKVPQKIAKYLKLPHPNQYTGHCFRRTSITHLVHGGGDLAQLKRHGIIKRSTVEDGYNEELNSITNVAPQQVLGHSSTNEPMIPEGQFEVPSGSGMVIRHCKTCTCDINVVKV